MILTDNEQKIINLLREAAPYQKIEITKDKDGKIDCYFIHISQKIVLTNGESRAKIY